MNDSLIVIRGGTGGARRRSPPNFFDKGVPPKIARRNTSIRAGRWRILTFKRRSAIILITFSKDWE